MNKKCRLLVTAKCPNNCPLCCNKQFDLVKDIPVISRWDYEEFIFTGGEPLQFPNELKELMNCIIKLNTYTGKESKFYLYTSVCDPKLWNMLIWRLDGITYTVHTQANAKELVQLLHILKTYQNGYEQLLPSLQVIRSISLRLNLFPEGKDFIDEELAKSPLSWDDVSDYFHIKPMEWKENCPIPEGEDFVRINNLF